MEILHRQNQKVKVGKSSLEGYGKIVISDKALIPGKEVELTLTINSIEG